MTQTILLVDDDTLIRDITSRYLQRAGYHVLTATNGAEGIDIYQRLAPDLIVLDVAMPEMSGFEVASTIRKMQREEGRAHIPIVLLTAYARSFFLSVGTEAGIDSYLTKPISPEQLLEHIKQFFVTPPPESSPSS
jgi:CheY-like chemotaxis protein